MSIKYRSLIEFRNGKKDISIWQYNTTTNKERILFSRGKQIQYDSWNNYMPIKDGDKESDITKQEAEELMFIEAI